MTLEELFSLIKHLKWSRRTNGKLRCAKGDCPIIAGYRLMFPKGEFAHNLCVLDAGIAMGLNASTIKSVVRQADDKLHRNRNLDVALGAWESRKRT